MIRSLRRFLGTLVVLVLAAATCGSPIALAAFSTASATSVSHSFSAPYFGDKVHPEFLNVTNGCGHSVQSSPSRVNASWGSGSLGVSAHAGGCSNATGDATSEALVEFEVPVNLSLIPARLTVQVELTLSAQWQLTNGTCHPAGVVGVACSTTSSFAAFGEGEIVDERTSGAVGSYGYWNAAPTNGSWSSTSCTSSGCATSSSPSAHGSLVHSFRFTLNWIWPNNLVPQSRHSYALAILTGVYLGVGLDTAFPATLVGAGASATATVSSTVLSLTYS